MSILLKNREIDGVKYLLNEENMTYYPTMKQDKQTGLTYTLDPDTFAYLPNLTVQSDERIIGRWGQKRKKFLKEHREWIYLRMMDE
ncbi:MAG: TnpV protein, partial [Clostridia bacterium]|nr:TnpV protein [Clostridia bacterium]